MLIGFLISFSISLTISFFWVKGIDNMKKNNPDYDGKDIF
jgi:hypothetical protein